MTGTEETNGNDRWHRMLIWALCLFGGMAVGVSGFSSLSNHPTYLPLGLHYIDPGYLAGDWWLGSAQHYHYAFFALTAVLAWIGILEAGLAVLNILAVAGALYACFRILLLLQARHITAALIIFIAIMLMTMAFYSVGTSYLFSPSLQPSTLATAATLAAMGSLLERRRGRCGLWLGCGGIFHVNFLVVNIAFFGLTYLLVAVRERPLRHLLSKQVMAQFLKLLGPSLLLMAILLPLILSVENEPVAPRLTAKADWIFFRFAVPFHYFPPSYLYQLPIFLAWELLGLLWTRYATPDTALWRTVWAMQLALAVIIWSATLLTTIVFIPFVSRLFLWRLAPFAVVLATLLTLAGTLKWIASEAVEPPGWRERITILVSFALLPFIALPNGPVIRQFVPTGQHQAAAAVLALIFLAAFLRRWTGIRLITNRATATLLFVVLLGLAFLVQPNHDKYPRYSLFVRSQVMREETALFDFVRQSTPRDALFLIPPDLDNFRLQARRRIVVDFKAMPMNRLGLIEWYRRLTEISGIDHPVNEDKVLSGFLDLDARRLNTLRCEFGIAYAVFRSDQQLRPPGWTDVFRNRAYRVMQYTGARACPANPQV